MSRISSKKRQHGLPRFDPSAGMMVQIIQVSANRASATLASEVCRCDLGAIGTRLLHFGKRAGWALMSRA
jgi:hypothetical protein